MSFKRQTIKVATYEQGVRVLSMEVPALVLGDLAVHRPLNNLTGKAWYHVITHVPSGFKLAEGLLLRNCKALVEKLHALNINWKFDAHFATPEFFERAKPVINEFFETERMRDA